jgi:hypothetical protein
MDLEVFGTLIFFLWQYKLLFVESNKVNDMHVYGSPHQVMKLILLAIHIKDQGILILLENLYCYLKENLYFNNDMVEMKKYESLFQTFGCGLRSTLYKYPLSTNSKNQDLKFMFHKASLVQPETPKPFGDLIK